MSAVTPQAEIPWVTSDIEITSSIDHSAQPARAYLAPGSTKRPMIVFLHAWSMTYQQRLAPHVEQWARDQQWRHGARLPRASWNVSSCASDLAIQDVLHAVAYARQHAAGMTGVSTWPVAPAGSFAMMSSAPSLGRRHAWVTSPIPSQMACALQPERRCTSPITRTH